MTDHAELRRLAGEAIGRSESEWYVVRGLSHVRDGEDNFICDTCEDEPILASYVATANPKTVLALLDEIDRLKAENEALLLGMRAILNAYDYADQYNKEGVAVEVMEDLRALFKGATK